MEGTGKLVMPGEKISWDQRHIHAVGEEIDQRNRIGLWFYPKGQEPTKAQLPRRLQRHRRFPARRARHTAQLDCLHRGVHGAEGEHHHHQLPAALPSARARRWAWKPSSPTGHIQQISYVGGFSFNWMTNYIYADDAAPAFPGTIIHASVPGMTIRRPTRTAIRNSGWAATARSMKWPTPGW